MQIKPDQLAAHLGKGLRPLYVIFGDEALLAQEAGDAIRAAARSQGFTDRQVHVASGAHVDWGSILGASQEMSLFGDRSLVEIRIPGGKPGKDGGEALQRYAKQLSDEVLTVISLPRLDGTQLKSAWFTALDAAGLCIRVDPIERRALPTWIAQRLGQQGQRVADGEEGQRTLAFFADRVEGNLLAAHQEVMKLGLLLPPGVLGYADIEQAVLNVARFDVFKLSQAVMGGQLPRALRMLHGLRDEGEAAVLVHWALAEDARLLRRVAHGVAGGRPVGLVLRELRVWGVKEQMLERLAPGLNAQRLDGLLQAARDCEGVVKGLRMPGWPTDAWDALERLCLMTFDAIAPEPKAAQRRGAASAPETRGPQPLALRA